MSVNMSTYIGKYFRVWMPDESEKFEIAWCYDCLEERSVAHNYCPKCSCQLGQVDQIVSRMQRMDSLFEDVFDNNDQFYTHRGYFNELDYWIVLPNTYIQGGVSIDSEVNEIEIDMPEASHHLDWSRLYKELLNRDIKFEEKFGIVNYWM